MHFTHLNCLVQPTLEGIVREEVPSSYHKTFMTGTSKEKYNLRKERKFGPCRNWSTRKVCEM